MRLGSTVTDLALTIRHHTPSKREITVISARLGLTRHDVFGKCVQVWLWALSNADNGFASQCDEKTIDDAVGFPGFAAAMVQVDWLRIREGGLEFPRYDRLAHDPSGELVNLREPLSAAERMRRVRERKVVRDVARKRCASATPGATAAQHERNAGATVAQQGGKGGSAPLGSSSSEEEKTTSEDKNPKTKPGKAPNNFTDLIPQTLRVDAFLQAWAAWCEHRRQSRKTMTERAARQALGDLAEMGIDRAVAAVRHSLRNGWTGIHEPSGATRPAAASNIGVGPGLYAEYTRQQERAVNGDR